MTDPVGGPEKKSEPAGETPPVACYTVLLVDRDPETFELVRAALPEDYEVVPCPGGDAAVEAAHRHAPDVIILNPSSGESALGSALSTGSLANGIPLVLLLPPELADKPEESVRWPGAVARLRTPFDPVVLHQQLVSIVEGLSPPPPMLRNNLGQITVGEVVELVEREIERWVLQAGGPEIAQTTVTLEEISDLVGALWTFIGRLRQTVNRGSEGRVAFGPLDEGRLNMLALSTAGEPEPVRDSDIISEVSTVDLLAGLRSWRAVIADDEPKVGSLLSRILQAAGMTVECVANGREALAAILRHRPDLVVTDILMPEMDGWALLRALRRDLLLRDLPVVVLSSKEELLHLLKESKGDSAVDPARDVDRLQILLGIAKVLNPHRRLQQRLEKYGEISGRVEATGIVPLLLALARWGKDLQLLVRDAWNVFEVDFRAGAVAHATHRTPGGHTDEDTPALRHLLGLSVGRYRVQALPPDRPSSLEGPLEHLLNQAAEPVQALIEQASGGALLRIQRLVLNDTLTAEFEKNAKREVSQVVAQLRRGLTPQTLLLNGVCKTPDLERILLDLTRRGGVAHIEAPARATLPPVVRGEAASAPVAGAQRADAAEESASRPDLPPPLVKPTAATTSTAASPKSPAPESSAGSPARVLVYFTIVAGVALTLHWLQKPVPLQPSTREVVTRSGENDRSESDPGATGVEPESSGLDAAIGEIDGRVEQLPIARVPLTRIVVSPPAEDASPAPEQRNAAPEPSEDGGSAPARDGGG